MSLFSSRHKPFDVPDFLKDFIEESIKPLGYSLSEPKKLAQAVLKLSDFFIRGAAASGNSDVSADYWKDPGHHAAYLSYFSVLNFVRARAVFEEVRRTRFLLEAREVLDWGCGAGAATQALAVECASFLPALKFLGMDKSPIALREFGKVLSHFKIKADTAIGDIRLLSSTQAKEESTRLGLNRVDTFIFSYVLNEMELSDDEPKGVGPQSPRDKIPVPGYPLIPDHVQRLILIEPSTNQAGRKLLLFRDKMIEQGWFAWAPCTHQEFCPLYNQSGRDWCHHRLNWNKPEWFSDLEPFLPMRNDTLTLSYVLLSRQPPLTDLSGLARVVGDEQPERGKTRQMICRGVNREFLSWLDRSRLKPGLKRGDLLRIRDGINKPKEVRISFLSDIDWIQRED